MTRLETPIPVKNLPIIKICTLGDIPLNIEKIEKRNMEIRNAFFLPNISEIVPPNKPPKNIPKKNIEFI